MTINHHLTDAVLMAYSAGSLPEAFNLVVASHISLCDECRARLGAFDAVGGAILEDCEEAALSEECLAATFERIGSGSREPIRARVPASSVFPAPLADYVGANVSDVRWRNLGGGVKQSILQTSRQATVRLLYIPAGAQMPVHGHRGLEMTLVLQGAYRDEDGRYGPGDVEVANEELRHTPVAEAGQDCVCLAATDAPLRFTGLIPRLAQPFFRI